jgi:hypothetical protein
MSPDRNARNKRSAGPLFKEDTVEKIGLTVLSALKTKSRVFYFTVEPKVVGAYDLLPGDICKLHYIEVRKHRERAEAPPL